MTEPVKRYEFFTYIDDDVAELDCHEADDGTWINAADYASLEQECERLRKQVKLLVRQHMPLDPIDGLEGWSEVVSATKAIEMRDAALNQVEELRALLADWSSHFTGPKVIGGPLSSLRERTDAALLNGGRDE